MEIRETIRTRPGRPWLAVVMTALMLALSVALAAWVSNFRKTSGVALADRIELGRLPLSFRPPAGWRAEGRPASLGRLSGVVALIDPAEEGDSAGVRRLLAIYRVLDEPAPPGEMLKRINAVLPRADQPRTLGEPSPAPVGPLGGAQAVSEIPLRPGHYHKEILRIAHLGRGQFVLLRMICSGPPLPAELLLMDRVAESVEPAGDSWVDWSDAMGRLDLSADRAEGDWLARVASDSSIVLTPRSGEGDAAPWAAVRLHVADVPPGENLPALLTDHALAGLADPGQHAGWPPLLLGPPHTVADPPPVSTRRNDAGELAVIELPAGDDGLIRRTWLFRPPGDDGEPGDRVIWLRGWAAPGDAAKLDARIERLAGSLRAVAGREIDWAVADARGRDLASRLADMDHEAYLPLTGEVPCQAVRLGPNRREAVGILICKLNPPGEALRVSCGWRQREFRAESPTAANRPLRALAGHWRYLADGTFVQTVVERIGSGPPADSYLQVKPSGIEWQPMRGERSAGESADNFLPHAALLMAARTVVGAHGSSQLADGPALARECRVRVVGPSGRPAGLRIEYLRRLSDRVSEVLLWVDYDPRPVVLRVDATDPRPRFRHGDVRWSPLPADQTETVMKYLMKPQ